MVASCQTIKVLPLFIGGVLVNSLLVVVGVVANFALLIALIRSKFLPSNVRLLLGTLTAGLLATSVNMLWFYSSSGWLVLANGYYQVNAITCALQAGIGTTNVSVVLLVTLGLALERFVCSRKLIRHSLPADTVQWPVAVGCALITALAVLTAIYPTVLSLNGQEAIANGQLETSSTIETGLATRRELGNNATMAFLIDSAIKNGSNIKLDLGLEKEGEKDSKNAEHSNTTNTNECWCENLLDATSTLVLLAGFLALESASLGIFIKVWRLNVTQLFSFSLNTARYSLAERFHMRRNIHIINVMLPAIAFHGLCLVSFLMSVVFLAVNPGRYGQENHLDYTSAVAVTVSFPLLVYVAVNPLILLLRCDPLSAALRPYTNQVQSLHNGTTVHKKINMETYPKGFTIKVRNDVRNRQQDASKTMEIVQDIWKKAENENKQSVKETVF